MRKVQSVNSKVQICVKTTAENGRCVQCEQKMSNKSEINGDCVDFRILVTLWPMLHCFIHR